MTAYLHYLPLFVWAVFAFGVLYSILESKFRPLAIMKISLVDAVLILAGHWRVAVALMAVFAATTVAEVLALLVLRLQGQPLLITAISCQGINAAAIAWIATYIHCYTLRLPKRDAKKMFRYRATSLVAGLTVFLLGVGLTIGSSLALEALGAPPRLQAGYLAGVAQKLIFVPMALVRPALSLGLRGPVRAAILAAARPPFIIAVWLTALALPVVAFDWVGGDIVRAHPSEWSVLAFKATKIIFSTFYCALFETTTLLLLSRETNGLFLPGDL